VKGLFIRPSNPTGSAYLKSFGFLPAPLGLLQLAADVMSLGKWEVRVLDMEADQIGVQEVLEVAESFDPDLIGITLHATAAHNTALRIAKGVKENSKEALLVAGGHHATFVPMEMLRGGFDVVVLGEGDLTIQEIAREVGEGRRDFSKIKGIVFNQGNRFVETPPAPLLYLPHDPLVGLIPPLIPPSVGYRAEIAAVWTAPGSLETSNEVVFTEDVEPILLPFHQFKGGFRQ